VRATLVSKNRHKAKELAVLMPGWTVEPIDVDELPEETGETFYENARATAGRRGRSARTRASRSTASAGGPGSGRRATQAWTRPTRRT
jgi:hypothetical protein